MRPSLRVAVEWLRRVEAEYTSAAVTQELVLWLIRLGAPPDLIEEGLHIVSDELVHATMSHAVAEAAGCERRPVLEQESLGLPRDRTRPLLLDAARHGVEIFCLGETVAVPLFVAMREACTVPVARDALDRIVRDEVRHRDFGFALLDWLLDAGGEAMLAFVQEHLPAMLARVRQSYGSVGGSVDASGSAEALAEHDPADAAWGLLPAARYAEILERCVQRDYEPRFQRVGLRVR